MSKNTLGTPTLPLCFNTNNEVILTLPTIWSGENWHELAGNIQAYITTLLGEDFGGLVRVTYAVPALRNQISRLILYAMPNGFNGVDVTVNLIHGGNSGTQKVTDTSGRDIFIE